LSGLGCCSRDADEEAHARLGGNHLHELEAGRGVQRAILCLRALLPPWTDEHIEVIQLAIAGGIAREQDFFDEEQRATRLDRAAAMAEEYRGALIIPIMDYAGQEIGVMACNSNGPGQRSRRVPDHIDCISRPLQDRIRGD
jgi:hypothetical protein